MTASSRTLPHVGEWKVELRASTIEGVFLELARTLADATGPSSGTPSSMPWERVVLHAHDDATLLVDWANELIGRSEVAALAYREVRDLVVTRVDGDSLRLTAEIRGAPVDEWVSPVKAATYHDASVMRVGDGWLAVVLFDV
jgi:SHS2 domain-containing protein